MRTSLIFILALTATAVLAATAENPFAQLKNDKFGKTLLATVALELKTNQNDPRPRITALLNDIEAELQTEQANHDAEWNKKQNDLTNSLNRLTNRVNTLQATNSADTETLNANTASEATSAAIVEAKEAQILDTQAAQNADDNVRAQENAAYVAFQQKYADLAEALRDIRVWIQDRQDEVGSAGFLQVPTTNFVQVTSKIDQAAKKNPTIAPIFAMIKSKLQIYFDTEGNFINGGDFTDNYHDVTVDPTGHATTGFSSILDLIDNLVATFEEYQETSTYLEEQNVIYYNDRSNNRALVIQTLQAEVASVQATAQGFVSNVATLQASIQTVNDEVAATQDELTQVQAAYAAASDRYTQRSAERAQQLAVVEQIVSNLAGDLNYLRSAMNDAYVVDHEYGNSLEIQA